jgi:dolichol kinase
MGNIADIVAGILLAGMPLLVFEVISRKYKVSPEITRKAVHVLASVAIAYMTLFLSMNEIAIIAAFFFVFFAATRKKQIWKALFQIKRKSYGEIMFAVGVIVAALTANDSRIFACAVLIMGFSDTAAAIIGQRYNAAHKLFGPKTIEGALGFFLVTIFLLGAFGVATFQTALAAAAIITLAELISKDGLDNIAVPLAAVLILNFI